MKKMNFSRGLLRAYLGLWLVYFVFLSFSEYRVVLTDLGVKHWSIEEVGKRRWLTFRCGDPEARRSAEVEIECLSIPVSEIVKPEDAKGGFKLFMWLGILFPAVLLVLLTSLWFLGRWVVGGCKVRHE